MPKTDNPFLGLLEDDDHAAPVILDGALGTMLDDRGVHTSRPLWSGLAPLTDPETLHSIHREYVEAGARVTTACTFRTTRRAFRASGQPEGKWREAARAAVEIARRATGDAGVVAGSMAPLEDCFSPGMAPTGSEVRAEHGLLAEQLVSCGVDVLWLETFSTREEAGLAAEAARDAGEPAGIPFAVSLVTDASGDLLSGDDLGDTVKALEAAGAAAISLNCIPTWFADVALGTVLEAATVPVGIYANLGRAEANQGWTGSAHLSPKDYAAVAGRWHDRGCRLIGACCGSTPDHLAALARKFSEKD